MDVSSVWWVLILFPACAMSQVVNNRTAYVDTTVVSNSESFHLGGLFPVRRSRNGVCMEIREAGVERVEGMVFAIRTINADSSILPRVSLTFNIQDTCAVANIALENSIEYVQSSDAFCAMNTTDRAAVSGVIGAAASSVSASTASFFRLFQIPQISYSSTAALLSDSTAFDYFFRTIPSDVLQTRAMADLIETFNWTYIFALYSDDTYGREGIASLLERLEERNATRRCVALRAALPRSMTNEEFYNSLVQKMNRDWVRNASVAVLFGHLEEAVATMDAIIRAADVDSLLRITWIASDSWSLALPEEYHSLARGMFSILPLPGNLTTFRSYFDRLNPNISANPWLGEYWELVFNCSLSEPSCNNGSRNLSQMEVDPVVTNVVDAVYAFAHALHQMILDHCPNQTLCDKITTTRLVGRAINGTLLREYIFNVSFPNTFSTEPDLLFDSNGDVQGSYLIKNLQFSSDNQSSFETVGTWDHINLLQLRENIQWNDGGDSPPRSVCSLPCAVGYEPRRVPDREQCCWTCEPCLGSSLASSGDKCFECTNMTMPNTDRSACVEIPVTSFTWSSPWAIVILFLACVGIVVSILVGTLFLVFLNRKVIKASSRELSALMLAGIFLCYIIPFLYAAMPTPVVCGVRRFAIGFCFAVVYSALFVRSNRIHRIFNRPTKSATKPPRFIGSVSQLVIASILISVQVLIAVIWLAVEQPSVDVRQINDRTVELRCGENPYFGLSISLAYSLFLLILSTYFAFLTRKVPDNFNEAKYINITLYSLIVIWIGFVPAYYVSVQFGTIYENFFLMLAVLSSASATLACLLVPKIFIVLREEKSEMNTKSTLSVDVAQTTISNL